MNKDERNAIMAKGMTLLRAQHDRTNRWKIVKQSRISYGWCRFGGEWYITRDDAEKSIERIVKSAPNEYIHDK